MPTSLSRAERRRPAILKAARELFIARGFEQTTTEDIIRAAGGSKATLYTLFGSKEQLFAEVMRELTDQIIAAPDLEALIALPPRAALTTVGRRAVDIVLDPSSMRLFAMLIAAAPRFPDLAKAFFANGPVASRRFLAAYLREATKRGQLEVPDPHCAAEFFFGAFLDLPMMGLLLALEGHDDKRRNYRAVTAAVDQFLALYGGSERKGR